MVCIPVEWHHVAEHIAGGVVVPVLPPVKLKTLILQAVNHNHTDAGTFLSNVDNRV